MVDFLVLKEKISPECFRPWALLIFLGDHPGNRLASRGLPGPGGLCAELIKFQPLQCLLPTALAGWHSGIHVTESLEWDQFTLPLKQPKNGQNI